MSDTAASAQLCRLGTRRLATACVLVLAGVVATCERVAAFRAADSRPPTPVVDAGRLACDRLAGSQWNEPLGLADAPPPRRPSGRSGRSDPWSSLDVSLVVLSEHGGRVSWSHVLDLIAFDRTGWDGFTDIYVMRADGWVVASLTRGRDGTPQGHNGNPEWHPSGELIVFQAQDAGLELPPYPDGLDHFVAGPGVGVNNNIWLVSADGSRFWQVTAVEALHGTLHPHFSPDGSKLMWSEMIVPVTDPAAGRMGEWVIRLADFVLVDGEPTVSNLRTLRPGGQQLYETQEFSPDGNMILFSAAPYGGYYYDLENYLVDVDDGHVIQLTANDEWDEQAHFTADAEHIVWVSSEGAPQLRARSLAELIDNPPKLDFWIMATNGSDQRRLTGFNDPNSPDHIEIEGGVGLGDFDFGPDGRTLVAKMRRGISGESTVLITFD